MIEPLAPGLRPLEHVRAIAPYVPGKPVATLARERGLDPGAIIKLASNENPLGMSPRARAALLASIDDGARYPDGSCFDLREALGRRHGAPSNWFCVGNGSNDILEMAASAQLAAGRSCVISQYSFAIYAIAIQARGARAIVVPARNFGHNLEEMAAAIEDDTHLVYVANPNNPTGTFASPDEIDAFLAFVPPRVMVVLDEAYDEFLPPRLRADPLARVERHPNVVVVRTFSKAYGLAGLRVGYALGRPQAIELFDRVRAPFNVSSPAQAAAAAALEDEEFLGRTLALNEAGVRQLEEGFAGLGLRFVPSRANFVLVEVGNAARVDDQLLDAGIIVRPVAGYGLPGWLRVSVGLPEENERLLGALARILGRP